MSDGALIIAIRCFDCGRSCTAGEFVRIGESVTQCWACYYQQREVVDSWAEPPKECAVCHVNFQELIRQVPGQPVSMFLHAIDGTYGLLCRSCSEAYIRKRTDQFRGTRFGDELKL